MHVGTLAFIDVPWISCYLFSHHAALLLADAIAARRISHRPPRRLSAWRTALGVAGYVALGGLIASSSLFALT